MSHADNKDPLLIEFTLASPTMPFLGKEQTAYLLAEFQAGEVSKPLPLHLSFLIDNSDSMRIHLVTGEQFSQLAKQGNLSPESLTDGVPAYQVNDLAPETLRQFPRRLDYIVQSLEYGSEYIRQIDTFSVIAFASYPFTLVPSSSGIEKYKLFQALSELEYFQLGNETHIAEGLEAALLEIQQAKKIGASHHIILLTDGFTKNVSQCYAAAKQAKQAGVIISTMGLGTEFNEDLLIQLAELTGGNAYYLETPEQATVAMRSELTRANRICYSDVEIGFKLPAGVRLCKASLVKPVASDLELTPPVENQYRIRIGDVDPTEPGAYLFEFSIPPWQTGGYRLAQAYLTYQKAGGISPQNLPPQDIVVEISAVVPDPPNKRVMDIVKKVQAITIGNLGVKYAQNGDSRSASQQFRQAAALLLEAGEPNLSQAMLHQADLVENVQGIDPHMTKKLRYNTRRLTDLETSA